MEIKKLEQYVLQTLKEDKSGHGLIHAQTVYKNASMILKGYKEADEEIIKDASYLHDCADHKLFEDEKAQEDKISVFLLKGGVEKEKVDRIIHIISTMSFSKGLKQDSIEGMIVSDADKLEAIGANGIIRTIEYGCSKGRSFYNPSDIYDENTTLDHFYKKLLKIQSLLYTLQAQQEGKRREDFLKSFLTEFYIENKIKPREK